MDEILRFVEEAFARSSKAVSDFKNGKTSAAKSIVGLAMSLSGGKIDPKTAAELVEEKLKA